MLEREFRVGELFCGAGGLALGAKLAAEALDGVAYQCRHVWAIDTDQWACRTFERNFGVRPIQTPVQQVEFEKLHPIDGLLFGFPCNDYSLVGEHKGLTGEFGPLYTYGVRAIQAHSPQWFLAENVSGLTSANDGEAFLRILEDLRKAGPGYDMVAHLYRFEHYGVPQMRHRVILVGVRRDLNQSFRVPAPTSTERLPAVADFLEGVEQVEHNNERTRHPDRTIEMLRHIPPGGNAWHPDVPEYLRLNVKNCRLSHVYRRLDPYKPAPTVTARGGGGTHGYHWNEPRALTNRERARIQSFPDDFIFEGPKESVRSQIGMAVPPQGIRVIINALFKTLAGISYPSIDSHWLLPAGAKAVDESSAAD